MGGSRREPERTHVRGWICRFQTERPGSESNPGPFCCEVTVLATHHTTMQPWLNTENTDRKFALTENLTQKNPRAFQFSLLFQGQVRGLLTVMVSRWKLYSCVAKYQGTGSNRKRGLKRQIILSYMGRMRSFFFTIYSTVLLFFSQEKDHHCSLYYLWLIPLCVCLASSSLFTHSQSLKLWVSQLIASSSYSSLSSSLSSPPVLLSVYTIINSHAGSIFAITFTVTLVIFVIYYCHHKHLCRWLFFTVNGSTGF